jgi:hypothetical protein
LKVLVFWKYKPGLPWLKGKKSPAGAGLVLSNHQKQMI